MGEIEKDGKVLVIKRIHTTYTLRGVDSAEDREKVERVHAFHADYCPVARSIRDAIDVSTELVYG